jgi:hypothetical protein
MKRLFILILFIAPIMSVSQTLKKTQVLILGTPHLNPTVLFKKGIGQSTNKKH